MATVDESRNRTDTAGVAKNQIARSQAARNTTAKNPTARNDGLEQSRVAPPTKVARAAVAAGIEPAPAGSIQAAIKQSRPFRSPAQEAWIGLMLTSEAVRWPFHDLLAGRHDLTLQQYNVLRILRGAGAEGLPTLEIGVRMFERTPGVTRLLDRLEAKGLVARERAAADRRQVFCRLTTGGADLLRTLDRPIDALDDKVMAGLTAAEQRELIRLLDKLRQHVDRST
jgi:DNA-binding MarR family transcriptional regulator